jgi:glycosyltransferase involved in cell wall biosynthesis
MLRLFDGFVLPGAWAKEYLDHHGGIEQVRTVYLPNVIDDETYVGKVSELRNEREALRSEMGIPKGRDARVLVSLARLEPIKGIMELMQGIMALEDTERGRLHLLIAGDGIQRAELQRFAAEHQLHNVRFMGHLEEMQILQLLAAADAFVLPSLRDPYPLAVVEAAFAALPLLLSHNVGCHPETLDDGVNGWLFDPVDVGSTRSALASLLAADYEQLRRMGQVSHEVAQRGFTTQAVVQRFVREITQ